MVTGLSVFVDKKKFNYALILLYVLVDVQFVSRMVEHSFVDVPIIVHSVVCMHVLSDRFFVAVVTQSTPIPIQLINTYFTAFQCI